MAEITRICIAGAGVIGSLFAAHLSRVAEVSALVRRDEHARALEENGLRVSGRAEFIGRVSAATSPDELPEPELVIVACKSLDDTHHARRHHVRAPRKDARQFAAQKAQPLAHRNPTFQ